MQDFNPIVGYDNRGMVFDAGERILRKVDESYFDDLIDIVNFYENFKKNNRDIVKTQLNKEEKRLYHKKHITTYPFEWAPNMFKDALIFHLELFLKLDQYRYTLKDGLPNNILFDGTAPVFIDFLSLIKKEKLKNEHWLIKDSKYNDLRYEVFDRMFIPYFIIPFLLMAKGDYATARVMLKEKACNMPENAPVWQDIMSEKCFSKIKNFIAKIKREPLSGNKNIEIVYKFLERKSELSFNNFIERLIILIKEIDVTPQNSGYLSYYEEKKENFNLEDKINWKAKQLNVDNMLKKYKPKTVLDLGANTGWFSMLAEKNGALVISIEIEESCVDNLYLYAKNEKLNIIPLQIAFENFEYQYFGIDYSKEEYPEYKGRDFKNNPLFDSAVKRLQSDMTMCLALAHHLVLGMGMSINEVMRILSDLTNKVLVLEFIGFDDALIKVEPTFFKNIEKYCDKSYNLDRFIEVGMRFFSKVEIWDSHPNTRKLIVFSKVT